MSSTIAETGAEAALRELEQIAPGVPLLGLGQTVFWDEPMKAGVVLALRKFGFDREFIAGVHDTDYFAKLPAGRRQAGRFKSFPHNDTTTRGFWSAAGEFSSLFGTETVVTKELLAKGGLRSDRLERARPNFLDEATEAWGWRGIASLDSEAPVVAEVPVRQVLRELLSTLNWALDSTVECIAGAGNQNAERLADELRRLLCESAEVETAQTLAQLYEKLAPEIYRFCSSTAIDVKTDRTTRLLRFNSQTAGLPRFSLAALFVSHATSEQARKAYDESVQGSGTFPLSRFGTGAIPFDLYIPGIGRGTIRLGNRGVVINTPKPQFLSLKKPIQTLEEFAAVVEAKFGSECVLVGKALTLIGMLAAEFVFVFHEGASPYVSRSRDLHQKLGHLIRVPLHPILRIRYETWSSMQVCCSWLKMPEPLQRPFGTEELCAPSLAHRWQAIVEEQQGIFAKLGALTRPVELIDYLDQSLGGRWRIQAEEYRTLHDSLQGFLEELANIQSKRAVNYDLLRQLKRERVSAEHTKGDHFRRHIYGKTPDRAEQERRDELSSNLNSILDRIEQAKSERRELEKSQRELVHAEEVARVRERRRSIELEAELKRLRLIRESIICSKGLPKANYRPSAWWFRLVCPDGLWFRETVDSATYYLEPLV